MAQTYIVCGYSRRWETGKKQKNVIFLEIDATSEFIVRLALQLAGQDPKTSQLGKLSSILQGRSHTGCDHVTLIIQWI